MLGTLALPLSALELRDAVRESRPFDPARLDRVLRVDPARGCVEVQASASWSTIADKAGVRSETFLAQWHRCGAHIGEAVATNAAGPDGHPIVRHVEGLTLVTAEGDLRRVNRAAHPELFALAVGGQGIFGTPYSITLNLASLVRAAEEPLPVVVLSLPPTEAKGPLLRLLVPPEALEDLLAESRARCDAWRTPIAGAEVRRTLPESETALRWASREFAEITLLLPQRATIGASVRATQVRRELIEAAIARGGSFPIACTPEATREQVERCYPQLRQLFAEKRRLDPAEKLVNPWYRHHRNLLWREACEVRWSR